jgi:hypothetical protein
VNSFVRESCAARLILRAQWPKKKQLRETQKRARSARKKWRETRRHKSSGKVLEITRRVSSLPCPATQTAIIVDLALITAY